MRGAARVVSAQEAVRQIPSDCTVGISGFVGAAHPEMLTRCLEERYLAEGHPTALTIFYAAGQGDRDRRGLNHLAHPGLLRRVIGAHWGLAPRVGRLCLDGQVEGYCFPQGVLCSLLRETAAGRSGVLTRVGMNTFIDPQQDGGRLNTLSNEELVRRVTLDGEEWLFYRSIPLQVALIRATTSDRRGNLTMEREGLIGEVLPMAQAAHRNGGIVIAQVERLVDNIVDPKAVRVPGLLVDFLVVSGGVEHDQTFAEPFNPAYVTHDPGTSELPPMPMCARKIIARRALSEIRAGDVVNLGIGLPEAVAAVAAEAGRFNEFTLTVESGPTGGAPASGLSFGCSRHPEAVIEMASQFDFYDGGGLDVAVLGAGEVDRDGSVNVSTFGGRFVGVGGFVNISSAARRVVFCFPFRAGELETQVAGGRLRVVREGRHVKLVSRVDKICFHGPSALARGQEVLYVTERAVFRLTPDGLVLTEVAPGIDIERDIRAQMEFAPLCTDPRQMVPGCFVGDVNTC